MEQLFSTFGIDWRLLLIQAINFGVLLAILTKFLYRPLMNVIDERQKKIAEGVRSAEAADQRLLDAKKEGDGIVGDAAKQAEGLVASARMRAESVGADLMKDAQAKAEAVVADARERAEEAKRQAMLESEREITKAAMLAAEKIMREKAA
ncbi:ATP synthase F0 subunit B [Candidatus Parcubacteria bacterium]|nr:MAG: ATP synthase F0 subunit B [Candidatus Parcubacteria bacterium]